LLPHHSYLPTKQKKTKKQTTGKRVFSKEFIMPATNILDEAEMRCVKAHAIMYKFPFRHESFKYFLIIEFYVSTFLTTH